MRKEKIGDRWYEIAEESIQIKNNDLEKPIRIALRPRTSKSTIIPPGESKFYPISMVENGAIDFNFLLSEASKTPRWEVVGPGPEYSDNPLYQQSLKAMKKQFARDKRVQRLDKLNSVINHGA